MTVYIQLKEKKNRWNISVKPNGTYTSSARATTTATAKTTKLSECLCLSPNYGFKNNYDTENLSDCHLLCGLMIIVEWFTTHNNVQQQG